MNPRKIDTVDYVVISVYLCFGLFICLSYQYTFLPQRIINNLLTILTFITPLSLYWLYFKRFRILSVWLVWLTIAILQAIILLPLLNNLDFKAMNGTYADSCLNLLIMLFVISIIRFIYRVFYNQEFVIASKFVHQDERKFTLFDYLVMILGMLIIICVPIVFKN